MTDEEIEKALECCACLTKSGCTQCPLQSKSARYACTIDMSRNALDYINRLKAEKEQIRKDTAKELLDDLKEACPQGYLGIGLWARQEYIKYGVEVDDE